MENNIEERLKKLEDLLAEVLDRMDKIEAFISYMGLGFFKELLTLVIGYSLPVAEALEAIRRLLALKKTSLYLDEISATILEAVSDCKGYSISEITRRVKKIRGRASRRIVSSRVKELESKGLLKNVGSRTRPKYVLSTC